MFERVKTVQPKHKRQCDPVCRADLWASARLLVLVFFGVALLAMSATAREGNRMGSEEPARDLDLGIDCSTVTLPFEIAPRHFVLNRITRCTPIRPTRIRSESPGRGPIAEADKLSEDATAVVSIRREPTAARLPFWSSGRDRFSNAQYSSSLISLRQTIRSVSR